MWDSEVVSSEVEYEDEYMIKWSEYDMIIEVNMTWQWTGEWEWVKYI